MQHIKTTKHYLKNNAFLDQALLGVEKILIESYNKPLSSQSKNPIWRQKSNMVVMHMFVNCVKHFNPL